MSHTGRALHGLCLLTLGVFVGRWTATIATVSAQSPSKKEAREILIGNAPIRLDDPIDSMLTVLKKQYKVDDRGKLANGDEFLAITTLDSATILGSVQVKQDKVVGAAREWGDIEASDALLSFFQKIYGAFESASSQTQVGVLKCMTSRKPDGVTTALLFDFDGRGVTLYLAQKDKEIEGKPFRWITVEESISK